MICLCEMSNVTESFVDSPSNTITNCLALKSNSDAMLKVFTNQMGQFKVSLSESVTNQISLLSTSPPFSSQQMFDTTTVPSLDSYCFDPERTPVNKKSFDFVPPTVPPPPVDSGTESICSESIIDDDCHNDIVVATEKVLNFFQQNNVKSHGRLRGRRSLLPFGGRSLSNTDLDLPLDGEVDGGADGDVYSDESTLSESSALSSPDFDSNTETLSPESIVAAIDMKLKQANDLFKNGGGAGGSGAGVDNQKQYFVIDNEHSLNQCGHYSSNAEQVIQVMKTEFQRVDDHIHNRGHDVEVINEDPKDDDDNDLLSTQHRAPLLRSTSLKTGKTPPGTPGGKKIVRFADALGLDLESVRHIVDDVPYVPPIEAFKGLKLDDDDHPWLNRTASDTSLKPSLRTLFCQPCSEPAHFLERVRTNKLCLENCIVTGPSGPVDLFTITCIIRVLNIGFEKAVTLRYTTNEWLTYIDVPGTYVPNSCDGFSDKFSVTFHIAVNSNGHQTMMPGQRLLFAFKYCSQDGEYWDNNLGLNYTLIYRRS